jgi:hypothetical protein
LAWKNLLLFNLYYFSIPILLKTLFSPWHRYQWKYGKGLDVHQYIEIFLSNIISRILGSWVRIAVIVAGLGAQIAIFLGGLGALLLWFFMPLVLLFILGMGIRLLL